MSGVKLAASINIDATHDFISEQTTTSLHCKIERSTTFFKEVNSLVKPMTGVVRSTPLRVGSWFGTWDLMVAPLYGHAMVLVKYFLKYAQLVHMSHEG
jgi:hypothetical protein